MELLLGSHVREHGNRIGRLAAFELEPATRCIRRIVFSSDGELGPSVMTRPLSAISLVHAGGQIELVPYSERAETTPMAAVPDVALLSRATRLRAGDRDSGPLVGLEVDPAEHAVVTVFGRHHWWSRRHAVPAAEAGFSTPGEIRISSSGTRAA